ncbi:EamA family transporter [Sphingomonas sp. BK235]|uniref:DMT family transporter n=1 Tax=Sphingomonas sp. BK235 TaxID=2512131 RepID=UPI00104FD3EB|nr:EamA family transporter [Sphingomonas sp. BK235]TCP33153.1 drug/metabolite transporter (DMT)-like permease [Sphingomonas sp. BK235]
MNLPRPNSTRAAVLVPFAIVTLIWGSTWIVIRDQLAGAGVPPSWSVSYRFLVAGATLAAVAAWRGEWRGAPLRDRGFWMFTGAVGLLQFVMNFNFVYRAEQHITSGLVAVTFALLLIPNALFARVFLGQRLGRQLLLGSVVAMAGVALLFVREARGDPTGAHETIQGIGLTLVAILSASVSNVMQATERARRYPMTPMLATAMLVGAAMDATWAWLTTGAPVFDARPSYVAGVLYLGLFASALAFTLYFRIIRTIGPAKAAYNSVIVPVIAMLLSTLYEGYRWTTLAAAGAALAGVGLVVALSARRPAR